MAKGHWPLLPAVLLLLLAGCSGDPGTGVKEVKWDRDACERCRMVLSDRVHSAQIRFTPVAGKRSQVLKFDDIGCAALWLQDKPFKDQPTTEIWVTDRLGGGWIDARTAHYVTGEQTPMEYGLGAQAKATAGSLDYDQAVKHITETETHFNAHGVDLLQRLSEQKKRREADATPSQQETDKTDQ